ncbi:MAG: 2-hydroxyacyl-CoA dehydratase family protein [Candidatus Bathyarchaeota archaeon]|nr:2-hydroxyacyl-CoA dehydratase family protein [Candidatus Bathyarchaeota archaeon]
MNETSEKKYSLEIFPKEIEELKNTIKTASTKIMEEYIERMRKTWPDRPEEMQYFDEIAKFWGTREKEIVEAREEGKKVIGYTCMFAPIELILAAGAIPVRVSSGLYDPVKLGNRVVPVEVCPVVRSTIGVKMVGLSPYLELSDALITSLTCDGMTKLSEILSDYKPVWTLCPPRLKDSEQSISFWKEELKAVKEKIEKLTGTKITSSKLKSAIERLHRATRAFRRLQDLRKGNPVIMGRDAMLVNQTLMWDDVERWTQKTEKLCDELERRVQGKVWACPIETPRVMIAGTPIIWTDNWKLPNIVEEANPQGVIVADELCSGDRFLYDPVGVDEWTMEDMFNAVADRYLLPSTCPCFTSEDGNEDRVNWIKARVEERRVDGVVYHVYRGCMLYAMEYMRIKKVLDKINVPVYYLDTDYTREDVGQIKTRVEAFLEMLKSRVEF